MQKIYHQMIEWVAGEVRTVPDTVWQLNNNFTILADHREHS
jgi:hypothetical protein